MWDMGERRIKEQSFYCQISFLRILEVSPGCSLVNTSILTNHYPDPETAVGQFVG